MRSRDEGYRGYGAENSQAGQALQDYVLALRQNSYVEGELSDVACYTDIRDSKSLISQSHWETLARGKPGLMDKHERLKRELFYF